MLDFDDERNYSDLSDWRSVYSKVSIQRLQLPSTYFCSWLLEKETAWWYMIPASIGLMTMSWRHLMFSSLENVFITSLRRLDQDEYGRLNLTFSEDVFTTSWSRPIYSSWPYVFKMSSRRFQDVFKTSCINVSKTFSRRLQDVVEMSSRHLQDVLQRYIQDVFKTYHQVKLLLLTRLGEVFNTFLRHSFSKTVIYGGICLGNTTSEKFMVSV